MRKIDTHVIHCSDSDHAHHDDVSVIRKWHTQERGWTDVGYHFFITKSGQRQLGRPIDKVPAAQKGFNIGSVATCISGKSDFTQAQFAELRKLDKELRTKYGVNKSIGHNRVDNRKTCPNFDVKKALKETTIIDKIKEWLWNLV